MWRGVSADKRDLLLAGGLIGGNALVLEYNKVNVRCWPPFQVSRANLSLHSFLSPGREYGTIQLDLDTTTRERLARHVEDP